MAHRPPDTRLRLASALGRAAQRTSLRLGRGHWSFFSAAGATTPAGSFTVSGRAARPAAGAQGA